MSAEFELASPPFDTSEVAAAKRGLKSAIERIEAEALPAWIRQPERAECANDCSATADLPAEIEAASLPSDASDVAPNQELESPIELIEAEAMPDWLPQPERAFCVNDCPTTADLPAEFEGAFPPFHASEIVTAEQGLESAIERIEAEAIPEWLRQPERAVRADHCPATAANQNEDSPGPLKRQWTRVTGLTAGPHTAPPGY
jgi:hypothetical protein